MSFTNLSFERGVEIIMKNKASTKREYNLRINRVIDYIDKNYKSELNLETLAEKANFSAYHFHRIFHTMTGETLNNLIKRIRLEKTANILLHNPYIAISDIAYNSGFSSQAVFARSFKAFFNVSATEFRDNRMKIPKKDNIKKDKESVDIGGVFIKKFPKFNIAYVRKTGSYDRQIGSAYKHLFSWAGSMNLITEKIIVLGIPYDNPHITDPEKCRFDACITISEDICNPQNIGIRSFSPELCGVNTYQGPVRQGQMEKEIHLLYKHWLPGSGYQPSDSPLFFIIKNKNGFESDFIDMDICLPVEIL